VTKLEMKIKLLILTIAMLCGIAALNALAKYAQLALKIIELANGK
jgi:hypothetical protein